ncbi:MAG TPA: DUF805 domain-containing protein [Gemmatimonadales bacterium]|nr:DUF805 domain-containing protein [Gemmatimonadales bacterium]
MHWFLLAWRKCATFQGRAHRTEFWMFVLVSVLILLGLTVIAGLMTGSEPGATPHPVGWLWLSFLIVLLLPLISASVRRLHDVGLSGWFQLLGFIPYLGVLAEFILLAWPGTPGENRFGAAPPPPRDVALEPDKHPDSLASERARLQERFGLRTEPSSPATLAAAAPTFDAAGLLVAQPWLIIAAFAALEVLLVGALGSWIAERLGFNFGWLTPVSGLIYGAAGFASARAAGSPALAGAAMAVVSVTSLFLASGIGSVPELPVRDLPAYLTTLVIVGILGMLASMGGGWIAERIRPR